MRVLVGAAARADRRRPAIRSVDRELALVYLAALAACPDGTGVPVDQLSRKTIEVAIDDMLEASGFDRYVASVDGVVAGAANMLVHDGIALLTGSATLPAFRRRGVQTADSATIAGSVAISLPLQRCAPSVKVTTHSRA